MTQYVTDGGLETDLIFHRGVDLPEFASFPLVEDERGRRAAHALLRRVRRGRREGRRRADARGPDVAGEPRLGGQGRVRRRRARPRQPGRRSSCCRASARSTSASSASPTSRSAGCTGRAGTGTSRGRTPTPTRPRSTTPPRPGRPRPGAELVTVLTLTGAGEAIGFVRAVRDTGLPAAVGFTVETDGRLPDGTTLRDAIDPRRRGGRGRTTTSSTAPTRPTSRRRCERGRATACG